MNTRAGRALILCFLVAAICLSASLLIPTLKGGSPAAAGAAKDVSGTPRLRTLIVGGGPDKAHNQFAIESNVRYVRRLLPPGTPTKTLFADGRRDSVNVQYLDSAGRPRYRAAQISKIDGPSRLTSFRDSLKSLSTQGSGPFLFYFTGHGSPDDDGGYDNNAYDMWDDDTLTVKRFAGYLDTLSPDTPVVLVMVQCFSGAFGNLLFQGGDPNGPWANRDFCGFFASVPSREAAGCTAEVNEADYHDFTSYFFAALTGHDRLGRSVSGADYNGDGVVGMNEAFAYTLIHDVSIDTPVCTSDVFLRRYVTTPDSTIFQTSYDTLHGWATPSQQAVLDGLSTQLGLKGERRLPNAFAIFKRRTSREGSDTEEERTALWTRFVRCAKSVYLAHELQNSTDSTVKSHFSTLLNAEAANPLQDSRTPAAPSVP